MQPAAFSLVAEAEDPDGIWEVEFFTNGISAGFGNFDGTNYNLALSDLSAGSYGITVKATDRMGGEKWDGPVTVTVVDAPREIFLTHPTRLSNGQFQIEIQGLRVGRSFSVLRSMNLSDWAPAGGRMVENSTEIFVDAEAPAPPIPNYLPNYFYRVVETQ